MKSLVVKHDILGLAIKSTVLHELLEEKIAHKSFAKKMIVNLHGIENIDYTKEKRYPNTKTGRPGLTIFFSLDFVKKICKLHKSKSAKLLLEVIEPVQNINFSSLAPRQKQLLESLETDEDKEEQSTIQELQKTIEELKKNIQILEGKLKAKDLVIEELINSICKR